MDTFEALSFLARCESRRIRPALVGRRGADADELEALDELDAPIGRKLPAFRIVDSPHRGERFACEPLSHRVPDHDNAPRLGYLCEFLGRHVLPLVEGDVRGTYRVELHDSYSYLPNREAYRDVFVFGRGMNAPERRVSLLPDPYVSSGGLQKMLDDASRDDVPWSQKQPKLFFAGTTTGDTDPTRNARIRACLWGATRPDLAELRLTSVAQMPWERVLQACPGVQGVMHPYVPVEAHFQYKYLLNIVGNTACWSRVPLIMSTQSLLVHVRHPDTLWYSPLLREGTHYVAANSVEGPDLERVVRVCRSHDTKCKAIVNEARSLATQLFNGRKAAVAYAAELLEEGAATWAA